MAYLGKYIRQILSRKETVIFPGFGSLIVSESRGIPSSGGKIDPPGMLIKFDAEHPKDDGRLAEEYAIGEGLSKDEATQQVLELVDAIKFRLDKGEKYHLELLGEFSRDDGNKVHFIKDVNWVIDPELFGLASLDLLELEDEAALESGEAEKIVDSKADEEPKVEIVKSKKTVMTKRAPVNKWKIIWIVVGALIAVLVLILLLPSGNDGVEFGKDGIVFKDSVTDEGNEPGQGDAIVEEGALVEQEEGTEDRMKAEEAVSDQQETSAATINHYYVVAGSFQRLQNATEMQNTLKEMGYLSEIIITENRMYRVAVQGYPTKQEAANALPGIKKNTGLNGAWVLAR